MAFAYTIKKRYNMAKQIATKKEFETENFKITVGTTDKKNPKTFYIEFNCSVSMKDTSKYSDGLEFDIANSIRKLSHKASGRFDVKKDTLAGATMSSENIKNGKDSSFTVWVYFMQDSYKIKDFSDVYGMSIEIVNMFSPEIERIILENNLEYRKNKNR